MSSFRKFGGLNYAPRNNITRSHYSNIDNSTISNTLGLLNSKIVSNSHLDLSGSSILNLGGVYFQNGDELVNGVYTGDLEVTGSLTVDGSFNFSGDLSFSGNLSIGGVLTVDQGIETNGSFTLNAATPVTNTSISWTGPTLTDVLGYIGCGNNKMFFVNQDNTDGWSFLNPTGQLFGIDNNGNTNVGGSLYVNTNVTSNGNLTLNTDTQIPGSNNFLYWTYTDGTTTTTLGSITCESNTMYFSTDSYTTNGWSFVGTNNTIAFAIDNDGVLSCVNNINFTTDGTTSNSIQWLSSTGDALGLVYYSVLSDCMVFDVEPNTSLGWSYQNSGTQVLGIDTLGNMDVCGNIVMSGTSGTNYLEFPDGTKQYSATGSASSSANSFVVTTQSAPCPNAGLTNPYNTGGYAGQYFSNVTYSSINLWIDLQSFPENNVSTYNDSISVEYKIFFDNCPSTTTPSTLYGECSGVIKLFPKRFVQYWGVYYQNVTANVLNSYTGLTNYNSTSSGYAPHGRQYWCYNTTNSGSTNANYAYLRGGSSFAEIQFIAPFGSGVAYCATCSLRVLDSSLVQTNPNSGANQGVKVYIYYPNQENL
jgi:hypothetical protein